MPIGVSKKSKNDPDQRKMKAEQNTSPAGRRI
jgi:hypothetical protein